MTEQSTDNPLVPEMTRAVRQAVELKALDNFVDDEIVTEALALIEDEAEQPEEGAESDEDELSDEMRRKPNRKQIRDLQRGYGDERRGRSRVQRAIFRHRRKHA